MSLQDRNEQDFLNGFHDAVGVDSWSHADFSVINGFRKSCAVDKSKLATAAASYLRDPDRQTPYCDWAFLDAFVFWHLFHLRQARDTGLLYGTENYAVQRLMDVMALPRPHPGWYQKLAFAISMWLVNALLQYVVPPLVVLALFWRGWEFTAIILGLLLGAWWAFKIARWILRIPQRRRGQSVIRILYEAYECLSRPVVSMTELRRLLHEARDLLTDFPGGQLDGTLFALLDHTCEKHPLSLVPKPTR